MDVERWRSRIATALAVGFACFAGSAGVALATGPSWQSAVLDDDAPVTGVACPSAAECFATSGGTVWTEQAGTLGAANPDAVADTLRGVSCSNTGFCMISGDSGDATPWTSAHGFGQTDQFDPQSDDDLLSLSCAPGSTDFCATLDHAGNLYTYSSGSWKKDVSLVGSGGISDEDWTGDGEVSCASSTFCVATLTKNDDDGSSVVAGNEWFLWNGTSWSQGSYHTGRVFGNDDDRGVVSLSCTSSTFCVATDSDGNAYSYAGSGSAWSRVTVDGGTTGDGSDLHSGCAGTSCLAVDSAGDWWTTTNGTSWTQRPGRAQDDSDHSNLSQVTCTTATACYLADEAGIVATYGVMPVASAAPTLPGSGSVGTPVRVTQGAWSNPDAALSDQWLSCDDTSANSCTDIDSATGPTYTPQSGNAGGYLMVLEDATIGFSAADAVASNFTAISNVNGDGGSTTGDGGSTGGGGSSTGGGGSTDSGGASTSGGSRSSGGGSAGTQARARIARVTVSGAEATVALTCPATSASACSLRVILSLVETTRGGKVIAVAAAAPRQRHTVTLAGANATVKQAATRKLTVRLDGTGRRMLSRFHRLAVRMVVMQAGKQIASGTLHFRQPAGRH